MVGGEYRFEFRLDSWMQVQTFIDLALSAAGQLGLSSVTIEIAGIDEQLSL